MTSPQRSPRRFSAPAWVLALAFSCQGGLAAEEDPGALAARVRSEAARSRPEPVATVEPAAIVREEPAQAGVITPVVVGGLSFSDLPTVEEISGARVFRETLFPSHAAGADDNRALAQALVVYAAQPERGDGAVFDGFLSAHPDSPWRAALLLDLGLVDRERGFYTRSMARFRAAWEAGRSEQPSAADPLIDRALGEYALLNAWVGRYEELDRIAAEVGDRQLRGTGGDKYRAAREGRETMRAHPQWSFRCGPYAVANLKRLVDPHAAELVEIEAFASTEQGTSLLQVRDLAHKLKLDYRAARRAPGAALIAPAVIHWKLGHFSALMRIDGDEAIIQDRTMDVFEGQERRIPLAAIEQEASGAYLVPSGPLQAGWSAVDDAEAATIWGKGNTGSAADPRGTGLADMRSPGSCTNRGMASYSFQLMLTALSVSDIPLAYHPPLGPDIEVLLAYCDKEAMQPAVFTSTNFGSKWTCGWISCVIDSAAVTNGTQTVEVYQSGGGSYQYALTAGTSPAQAYTGGILKQTAPTRYELALAHGERLIYAQSDGALGAGRRIYLSQMVDPSGNVVNITYEAAGSGFRIQKITDAVGQVTTFSYRSDDVFKVDHISDPFGRTAGFAYNGSNLASITDPLAMVSSFAYDGTTDIMTGLTTPYGTTTFRRGSGVNYQTYIEAVDPQGDIERAEFVQTPPGIPDADPIGPPALLPGDLPWWNSYLSYRNTFYWDKKAMRKAPGDYTAAIIYHWLHSGLNNGMRGRLLESIKPPLTGRTWFHYPGQNSASVYETGTTVASPRVISRLLDDRSTQTYQIAYSSLGIPITTIDPLGRATDTVLDANGIDIKEVRQRTGTSTFVVLCSATYNAAHLPLTTTDAAGNVTKFTYNAKNQIETVTNVKNEKTTYLYRASGYLDRVRDPLGTEQVVTFDGYGRLRTSTDVDGHALTFDYDALDRPTKTTYPDGTFEQTVWSRLDVEHVKDRLGRWSDIVHNALGQPTAVVDSAQNVTLYEWCKCGKLQVLTSATGAMTRWDYDIMGRLTAKHLPDGKRYLLAYLPVSGRIDSITDPKGQITKSTYAQDDRVLTTSYQNAVVATAGISVVYDPIYPRVASMVDGTGTTQFTYYPIATGTVGAGGLATIDGPLNNDTITLGYDALMRQVSRKIGSGPTESVTYDTLGRPSGIANALGAFTPSYVGNTDRLLGLLYPNGMTASFDYLPVSSDSRLAGIHYRRAAGAEISAHTYVSDAGGRIQEWGISADGQAPSTWKFAYDGLDRLISARRNVGSGLPGIEQAYRYDVNGNRTGFQNGSAISTWTHNTLNQLTSAAPGGTIPIIGTISEPGTVTIAGNPAEVHGDLTFTGSATFAPGQNSIAIVAKDLKGNTKSTAWKSVDITGSGSARQYDDNGNLTTDGVRTFSWDAEDRLVSITAGNQRSEFTYDGFGRRVRILESANGSTLSDRRYIWHESRLLEERDSSGATVMKRYFANGIQISGVNYFYAKDHLGSVREVTDASGGLTVRYDYDPYGARSNISGILEFDIGFTGHFRHSTSNLWLTFSRSYDPSAGGWLSRDPVGELGGANLYAYVNNMPTMASDPDGRFAWLISGAVGAIFGAVVSGGISVVGDLWNGRNVDWRRAGLEAGKGALAGAIAGATFGLVAPAAGAWAMQVVNRGGSKLVPILVGAGVGAATGAYGDLAAQGTFIDNGLQDCFDWRELAMSAALGGLWGAHGSEYQVGPIKIAPTGNRAGNNIGTSPHYHRAQPHPNPRRAAKGESAPGQGMGNHRPLEGGW